MRIQHNISAMNTYRNFTVNSTALSKNIEKLSSGYRINRSGDDAAGLAISEKMRAQITGLSVAQRNANDGISLVQTAEGALTEVHDMLNRMYELAEQSANGTYDGAVDRVQLQKEVGNLKTEINRIADSANFNGINLLDGTLSGAGNISGEVAVKATSATASVVTTGAFKDIAAGNTLSDGDSFDYTVSWTSRGRNDSKTLTFTFEAGTTGGNIVAGDGTKYSVASNDTTTSATAAELANAVLGELRKDAQISALFRVENDGGNAVKYTSIDRGTESAEITGVTARSSKDALNTALGGASSISTRVRALNSMQILDLSNVKVLSGSNISKSDVDAAIFSLDGNKFLLVNKDVGADQLGSVPGSVNIIRTNATGSTYGAVSAATAASNYVDKALAAGSGSDYDTVSTAIYNKFMSITVLNTSQRGNIHDYQSLVSATVSGGHDRWTRVAEEYEQALIAVKDDYATSSLSSDRDNIAAELTRITGMDIKAASSENGLVSADAGIAEGDLVYGGDVRLSFGRSGLTLQIGDTSAAYNLLKVAIEDTHTASLEVDDVDVSTQTGAVRALDKIRNAINTISDIRGTLGAAQNRQEHTIQNLSVMQENLQNAESTIRDTDVAEEMMSYTKNNVLNQSAQTMLAQANQVPQGILRLLQG